MYVYKLSGKIGSMVINDNGTGKFEEKYFRSASEAYVEGHRVLSNFCACTFENPDGQKGVFENRKYAIEQVARWGDCDIYGFDGKGGPVGVFNIRKFEVLN